MLKKGLFAIFIGFLGLAYKANQPPPPKLPGSPGGPAITAPRIKLSDGRYLAYKEHGVPKDEANYKIVFVHGFDNCRHHAYVATKLSPEVFESLGVYIVSYDRPGYGESDPNPKRTIKSMAFDIEELADQLGLGSKFYVIGYSMGGHTIWSCLNYIPHRLAGATLLAPVVNYWWAGFPSNVSRHAYKQQFVQDQLTLGVAHYFPWLTYWWNTQKWFPSSSVANRTPGIISPSDAEILSKMPYNKDFMAIQAQVRQQGEYGSIHQDLKIGFGKWEFDPMEIKNPFPNNNGSVHLWQGDDDRLVPLSLQRYIAQRLPWIQYHELNNSGHVFLFKEGLMDTIVKTLLLGNSS
jgi:pimeloyl-ACP methyl ester carboxylesterase